MTNQWVNSYKRLVPGYEAPVYICWSRRNRSAMVRVPLYKPGKENATRVELRNPDPACNPYLAFAAMLAAGLDGIEKGLQLPPEAGDNIYEMTVAERDAAGIPSLPENLNEAVDAFEQSELMREALGDHVCEYVIRNKRAEWSEYKALVTPYEIERYSRSSDRQSVSIWVRCPGRGPPAPGGAGTTLRKGARLGLAPFAFFSGVTTRSRRAKNLRRCALWIPALRHLPAGPRRHRRRRAGRRPAWRRTRPRCRCASLRGADHECAARCDEWPRGSARPAALLRTRPRD